MMKLPFTKCAMSLTDCWSQKRCDETALYKNLQSHSLAIGHRKRCDGTVFHKMCNIAHLLLVIGNTLMRLPFTNVQCHSLPVGYRKRCHEPTAHKMCNVTHKLLVMGKYVMRLPFTKCAMSLTCCCTKGWLADISDLGNDRPMLIYPWVQLPGSMIYQLAVITVSRTYTVSLPTLPASICITLVLLPYAPPAACHCIIRTLFQVRRWDLSMDRLTGYQINLDNGRIIIHTHIRSMFLRWSYVFLHVLAHMFS